MVRMWRTRCDLLMVWRALLLKRYWPIRWVSQSAMWSPWGHVIIFSLIPSPIFQTVRVTGLALAPVPFYTLPTWTGLVFWPRGRCFHQNIASNCHKVQISWVSGRRLRHFLMARVSVGGIQQTQHPGLSGSSTDWDRF